ncbi:hypothetical protein SUGI_0598540 [Cryptomeria japonica]|nr:hypothetical protein SUGI_0598540 [Cryptomeria japonica]
MYQWATNTTFLIPWLKELSPLFHSAWWKETLCLPYPSPLLQLTQSENRRARVRMTLMICCSRVIVIVGMGMEVRSPDTAAIPSEISVDSKNSIPLLGLYGEGYQHYRFNGSSWINFNVSALLYTSPGQQVVGRHYFLSQADDKGGEISWELSMPSALGKVIVTTKLVSTVIVDKDSIPWTKLEATSYTADPPYKSRSYIEKVKYVQRVSTVGGLPPKYEDTPNPETGNIYLSPFSTIYWFSTNSTSL